VVASVGLHCVLAGSTCGKGLFKG
jgi:hypothetical protein